MKTISKNLYTIGELKNEFPKAYKKAHDEFISHNDYMFLGDSLNERLHEILIENNIKDLNDTSKPNTKPTQVNYSLSNSQGDGCSFIGEFVWNKYNISITRHNCHYVHEKSTTIEMYYEEGELTHDVDEDQKDYKQFQELYFKICNELEEYGYGIVEYEDSEENFIESCNANDYYFNTNGEIENAE